jgi:TolB protein
MKSATKIGSALCAGWLLSAVAAEPRYKVAFASFAPLDTDIFIADADGNNARPFLAHPDLDSNASFSHDGKWVIFTSRRAGSSDIYRAHPDGSALEALVGDPAYDDQAALSPNGRLLAFVSSRGGQADIWVLDLASKQLRNLTQHRNGDFRPAWSPDGQWLAFSSDRDSTLPHIPAHDFAIRHVTEIYIMRADGTAVRRITHDRQVSGSPSWSADGKQLAFFSATMPEFMKFNGARRLPGTTQIETVDLDTNARRVVSAGDGEKWTPRWVSPRRIGYVSREPTGGLEFVGGTAGARGDFRHASWSRNGRHVVFHREVDTKWPPHRTWHSLDPQFSLLRVGVFPTFSPAGDRYVSNDGTSGMLSRSINLVKADGTGSSRLYGVAEKNSMAPSWSWQGERVAFSLGQFFPGLQRAALADVAIINADGTGFEVLTDGKANYALPAWSRDGRQLVYRRGGNAGNALEILEVATRARRELLAGPAHYNFPSWSPAADRIAFTSDMDGDYEVYTIGADGSDLKRLTNSPWNDAHNTWSPDGLWIAFASGRGGFKDEAGLHPGNPQSYGEICVMRADGSDVRVLTDDQFEDGTPTWVP